MATTEMVTLDAHDSQVAAQTILSLLAHLTAETKKEIRELLERHPADILIASINDDDKITIEIITV